MFRPLRWLPIGLRKRFKFFHMTNEVLHDPVVTRCSRLAAHTLCHSALWLDGAQFLEAHTSTPPCPSLCPLLPCSLPPCLPERQLTIHPSRPVPDAASFSNVLVTTHLHFRGRITLSAWSHKALYFAIIGLTRAVVMIRACALPLPNLAVNSPRAGSA